MKWEKIKCDLCRGDDLISFLNDISSWEYRGKFNLVKCLDCSLVFVNPRPSPRDMSQFYSADSYWGNQNIHKISSKKLGTTWMKSRNSRYKELYQKIFSQFPKPGKILDVGCGTGGFLTAFMERKWQVVGTEISRDAANYSQKTYGFSVKIGDLLDINFGKKKFSTIVLNNVLEHLFSPKKTLEKIRNILNDTGLLVVSVPNIESLGFKIFKSYWYPLQPPRHLYLYSPQTIRRLLEQTGFKIIEINYKNWSHNYYSFYESFRLRFSPRFKNNPSKGPMPTKMAYSNLLTIFIKEVGKIVDYFFALFMAKLGILLHKGEVMSLYAQKA